MKDITREELLTSKEYWTADIQMRLFAEVEDFMKSRNMTRSQFADYLGCTKGYVTQLLSGDFDNKLSKFVEIALAIGKIPEIIFKDVDQYILINDAFFQGVEEIPAQEFFTIFKKTDPYSKAA